MTLADIHCTDHGNAEVATVTGEIDLSNTQNIRRVVTQAMSNKLLVLILDLSRVDFFDSAGIQLIYQLRGPPGSRPGPSARDSLDLSDKRCAPPHWAATPRRSPRNT